MYYQGNQLLKELQLCTTIGLNPHYASGHTPWDITKETTYRQMFRFCAHSFWNTLLPRLHKFMVIKLQKRVRTGSLNIYYKYTVTLYLQNPPITLNKVNKHYQFLPSLLVLKDTQHKIYISCLLRVCSEQCLHLIRELRNSIKETSEQIFCAQC